MSDHGIAVTQHMQIDHSDHSEHFDPLAGKIGMWLFLFTEVMLFGTLFIVFAVYLHQYRFDFQAGSAHLDTLFGATNTVILLTSSLTMALAISALERARKKLTLGLLLVTILFALCFLVIKSVEWEAKIAHDIYPKSATMLEKAVGEQIFYGLYFTMTGLHALHVVLGGILILFSMAFIQKGTVGQHVVGAVVEVDALPAQGQGQGNMLTQGVGAAVLPDHGEAGVAPGGRPADIQGLRPAKKREGEVCRLAGQPADQLLDVTADAEIVGLAYIDADLSVHGPQPSPSPVFTAAPAMSDRVSAAVRSQSKRSPARRLRSSLADHGSAADRDSWSRIVRASAPGSRPG